ASLRSVVGRNLPSSGGNLPPDIGARLARTANDHRDHGGRHGTPSSNFPEAYALDSASERLQVNLIPDAAVLNAIRGLVADVHPFLPAVRLFPDVVDSSDPDVPAAHATDIDALGIQEL